ncbi:MAG: peptide chain release factor [Pseudomonadota bacterium]
MKPSMQKKLAALSDRIQELNTLLSSETITNDMDHYRKITKEHSDITPIVDEYHAYKKNEDNLNEAQSMLSDPEMKEFAQEEIEQCKLKLVTIEDNLQKLLLPKDPSDEKNIFLEIRAGTGGDESALFAGDLFRMYSRYTERQGWKMEIVSSSESEVGGYKEIIASIVGRNVFSKLKFESGVHRVQRVPDTETQGRIHTSAATVAVLPEAEEVDVKINDADLRIDVFRSSGPGGQSVNTTDSAVRVTHIPSGIVVSQQDEKSQHKNKAKALKILRSKLYDLQRSEQESERAKARKSQIGTGDRSERIRTYNFPQGRVTDHRINMTLYKLTDFLAGDAFKELSDAIQIQFQEEQLENLKI